MKNKFELEHIGINTANAEEAANLAQLLSTIFNLEPRHVNLMKKSLTIRLWCCLLAVFMLLVNMLCIFPSVLIHLSSFVAVCYYNTLCNQQSFLLILLCR